MKRGFAVVLLLGLTLGTADAARPERFTLSRKGKAHSQKAWSSYRHRMRLPNGLRYGDSVRNLDLSNLSQQQIWELLMSKGFKFVVTVLRDKAGDPIVVNGKTIPLHLFTHADGGTVRVKPDGDPTSRFMPQPHLVKSVRWPYDAPGDGFQHEGIKVSNAGAPLPRTVIEMSRRKRHISAKSFADRWASQAHTDVVPGVIIVY